MTLDDVIALEEQKLGVKQRKSLDLNPYQAVPPISQSLEEMEDEQDEIARLEEDSKGGGYSQIHKV